jgi:hypothetical protein
MSERLIDRLAERIGYQSTARLIRAFSGRRLYVPQSIDEEHPIRWVIGASQAEALAAEYGGQYLDLPDERMVFLELRNRRIAAEYQRGVPVRQIASTYALSPPGVRKILNKLGLREGEPVPHDAPEQTPGQSAEVSGRKYHLCTPSSRQP